MKTLADDHLQLGHLQVTVERSIGRALQRVIRPQHLLAVRHGDRVVRPMPRMRTGKRTVARWMPVLRGKRMIEPSQQTVDYWHDRITLRHREFAARHERRLHINQPQYVRVPIDPAAAHLFAFPGNGFDVPPVRHVGGANVSDA